MAKKKRELKDLDIEEQEATDVKGGLPDVVKAARRARPSRRLGDPVKSAKERVFPDEEP